MKSLNLKRFIGFTHILIIAILAGGCASVYTSTDFSVYQYSHDVIALVPFNVSINPEKRAKHVTAKDIADLEEEQSKTFQRALYSQLLNKQQRSEYTVEIQDIDETNYLLKHHFDSKAIKPDLSTITKVELCEILKVDAVISGNMTLAKPMRPFTAIASYLLLGLVGSTNQAFVNISIHEGTHGKLLWHYDHAASGGLGSSPEGVAKSLMWDIAWQFPYSRY